MAREHARVLATIWNDPDWTRLSESAQRLYILALSQPDVSYAGVLAPRYKRWSTFSANSSVSKVRRAVRELEEAGFVVVDDDTEELWIRTFVKHDGLLNMPNVTRAMVKAFRAIQSERIRKAFVEELVDEFQTWGFREDRPKGWAVVCADRESGGMGDVLDSAA